MNICEPFIRRPVMTTLLMVSITVFGIFAYFKLPVSDLPNVDFPTIQVIVTNPGSTPETMASTCATPLEREFMTIAGLQNITSSSTTGQTSLVLQFDLNRNIDSASLDVEAAINRAQPNLPPDLPYNPTYKKVNPSATPILYMAITSDSMDLAELYDYGNTYIGQRLSMIDGISQVITYGQPYAARIQINPEKIAGMGVSINDIANTLRAGNVNIPTGTLFGPKEEFTIQVDGQIFKADGYQELVVRAQDGSLVKIADIGRAVNSLKNDKIYLNYKTKEIDKPCVILAVQKQVDGNTVAIIDKINQILPVIEKQLPSSLEYHRIFDKSNAINDGVDDVKLTLMIAFVLVVLIIYFSLGKLFNTVIPSLALPLSIVGTFIAMEFFHFSIDILSLLALTLSIGFLVDDAIVVLENNVRHVQMGEKPFEGTLKGSKEIGVTVLSMTSCLVAVFIPMLFMGGVVGRLFREFAMTIIIAVIFSGIISLTLTPLLCSRFIPAYNAEEKKKWMERVANYCMEKMIALYKICLAWTMKHRFSVLGVGVFCIAASAYLVLVLPKGFLPDDDVSFLRGFVQSRDGTSPFQMADFHKQIGNKVIKSDAVEYLVSAASTGNDNEGFFFVKLKPYSARGPIQNVIKDLSKTTATIPGVNTYLSTLPLINLQVGANINALYQYSLTSVDQSSLNKYADLMRRKMYTIPGLAQISSDLQITQPQLEVAILRDRASDLNIDAGLIEQYFMHAYSTKKVSTINTSINQYDVILETLPEFYKNPNVLASLYLKSRKGHLVPMNEVVKITEDVGPLMVNHLNGLPSATIYFNLDDMPLGTAVDNISKMAKDVLPPTVTGAIQGTANVFKESFATLPILFLATIFIIYVILGILYESFIHPLTVLSALPPTVFGGLLMLYISGAILDLYSFVGLIMLIGIVMKNGIMMVDFANQKIEEENKNAFDAIYEACIIRFRPVFMTSISAFMGALPIAIGIGGAGAITRRPLGLAIVGGLVISQILTLFLTPVIYYYLEIFQEKVLKKKKLSEQPKA